MGGDEIGLGRSDTGATGVQDMEVVMRQGPLGQLSIGGEGGSAEGVWSTKSAGDSAGKGKTGTTGVLATRSTGEVGVSYAGDKGACAEDGVGRAGSSSPICCNIVVFIARTMSRIKSGESLARLLG